MINHISWPKTHPSRSFYFILFRFVLCTRCEFQTVRVHIRIRIVGLWSRTCRFRHYLIIHIISICRYTRTRSIMAIAFIAIRLNANYNTFVRRQYCNVQNHTWHTPHIVYDYHILRDVRSLCLNHDEHPKHVLFKRAHTARRRSRSTVPTHPSLRTN